MNTIRVAKFGGTSLMDADRIRQAVHVLQDHPALLVYVGRELGSCRHCGARII